MDHGDDAADRGEPFDLGPHRGRPVLILHGLTGTPWEVLPVGRRLAQAKYRAVGPRTGGHASFEDLGRSSWRDWVRTGHEHLQDLSRDGPIAVVGFSMGALVAMYLAQDSPHQISALVLMGTPLQLRIDQRVGIQLLRAMASVPGLAQLTAKIVKPQRTDCSIPSVAAAYPGFDAFPRQSLIELCKLQDRVRPRLHDIACPTLLLHGRKDHSAPVSNVARVTEGLSAAEVTSQILERSFHQIAWDRDQDRCIDAIANFLATHYPATQENE